MNRLIAIVLTIYCLITITACRHSVKNEGIVNTPPENLQGELILLDRVSDNERTCTLIDSSGKILKEFPFSLVIPLMTGNFLGSKDSVLVRFDKHSNILWKANADIDPHHEITTDEAGNIYFLSSDMHDFLGLKVRFDGVKVISPEGRLLNQWCVFDHLDEFIEIISKSAWTAHLPLSLKQSGSIEKYIQQMPSLFIVPTDAHCDCDFEFTHFNALQILPENKLTSKIPAFKKGNLLISFHPYSSYGILNLVTNKIEWVGYLPERTRLHAPYLTPQGTILVFQNSTDSVTWLNSPGKEEQRKVFHRLFIQPEVSFLPKPRLWTSVTEYDPITNNKIWEYTATPKESLKVNSRGNAQRLLNGNTLICTTTKEAGGRVFEVTPDKRVVWEYIYPKNDSGKGVPWGYYRARKLSPEISKLLIEKEF